MAHPLLDRLSEPKVRWWIAGGVVVLALALGGFALSGRGGSDAEAGDGPALNIAVVAPPEREVQPGEVMDVGALNDGFDGKMPERVEGGPADVDYYAEQPAYVEDDWRRDAPSDDRYDRSPNEIAPPYAEEHEHRGRPMAFGFDRPMPDWRAEREARRAALEAREEARREDRRLYSSHGPSLDRDSEFY